MLFYGVFIKKPCKERSHWKHIYLTYLVYVCSRKLRPDVVSAPEALALVLFGACVASDRIPASTSSGQEERIVWCTQSAGRLGVTLGAAGRQDSDATARVWCCVWVIILSGQIVPHSWRQKPWQAPGPPPQEGSAPCGPCSQGQKKSCEEPEPSVGQGLTLPASGVHNWKGQVASWATGLEWRERPSCRTREWPLPTGNTFTLSSLCVTFRGRTYCCRPSVFSSEVLRCRWCHGCECTLNGLKFYVDKFIITAVTTAHALQILTPHPGVPSLWIVDPQGSREGV